MLTFRTILPAEKDYPEYNQYMKEVSIIMPVYFDSEYALRAIESVIKHTNLEKNELIVIDDSGDKRFNEFFKKMLKELDIYDYIKLVVNNENKGYIESCNIGLEQGNSEFILILHQDTLVFEGWLNEMLETAKSDDKIALVNPSTNYAPILNIDLPEGFSINELAAFVKDFESEGKYIDIVTATDFCVLIKKNAIDKFGFIDSKYEKGFGAIADLHFRFVTQGLRAVTAYKSFVYHKGSGIEENPNEIYKNNREVLMKRYKDVHDGTIDEFTSKSVLNEIRKSVKDIKQRDIEVLFVSPTNNITGGGAKIIHNICNSLNEAGINSSLASTWLDKIDYRLDRLYEPFYYKHIFNYDIKPKVIAYSLDHQSYEVIKLVRHIEKKYKYTPIIIYLGQDVEGWFEYHDVESFVQYANLADQIISVSPFVGNYLENNIDKSKIQLIPNSISSNFYCDYLKNTKNKSTDEITLISMMREDTKRGADVVLEALEKLDKRINKKIKFIGFGGTKKPSKTLKNIEYEYYERISEEKVKELLAKSDLFIEASFYQGFGLVAIEALFAGNSVLSSTNAGATGVLPETERINFFKIADSEDLVNKMFEFVNNPKKHEDVEFNILKSFSHRFRFKEYVEYFNGVLQKSKNEIRPDFERRAVDALLEFYKFVEDHYIFDPPKRTRYKLVDTVLDSVFSVKPLKKLSEKTVTTIKKLKS